ncbi:unnamed protein product [Sphagnum jensenii]|uniref:Cilia- and flagella-associated protein 263 n=1 Tax=Sphagnum jensenii TaxID=128206 RepID=A0ABP1A8A7_9BRYO
MLRKGAPETTQTQLDSLEELDEIYDELNENQGELLRRASSRLSYNILGSQSSDSQHRSSIYRTPWLRNTLQETPQGLNIEEKCDIAVVECGDIENQMNIYRQESEHVLDELQAAYDEAELSIGEIRRYLSDFNREVMLDAKTRVDKKAISEKVLKFLEQKVKDKRFNIEKLREQNATLKSNIVKIEQTLDNKKQLSDVLHAVDFDQLSIQKQQLENRLHDRDKEFHRLKATNLKTISALEKSQAQLKILTEKNHNICKTLAERKPQLDRVKDDIVRATNQKTSLQESLTLYIQERDGQLGDNQPSVIEYMELKKQVEDLEKLTHTWKQKVEVAKLISRQSNAKLNKMRSMNS